MTSDLVSRCSYAVTFGCLDRCPVEIEAKSEDWPLPGATNKGPEELRHIRSEISARVDDLIRKRCLQTRGDGG